MSDILVTFPGGSQVAARSEAFEILTDQPVADGGSNAGPSPYDLFLSSVATCSGFYALRFCQERHLATAGLALRLAIVRHPETRRLEQITLHLTLPQGFPEKYRKAISRAIDQCSVKKILADPPIVSLAIEDAEGR